jgi:xylose isomerase
MDAFAKGLKVAAKMIQDGALSKHVANRYSSWDTALGKKIEAGQTSFADLEKFIMEKGEAAANQSGRQELLENVFNRYLDR